MRALAKTGLKSGRANILTPEQFDHLLAHVQTKSNRTSWHGLRDFAMLLLSYKGALRACEIAGLNWRDVMDAAGSIGKPVFNSATVTPELFFDVPPGIAKKGSGRRVPMHDQLVATLRYLKDTLGPMRSLPTHPIVQSTRHPHDRTPARMSPHAVVQYMIWLHQQAGLDGSSHSGRRTALTRLAQMHTQHDCSLIDVQHFAGHANLEDTHAYVEASPYVGRMVRSL